MHDVAEVGSRFGRLAVTKVLKFKHNKPDRLCVCTCGRNKRARRYDLVSGRIVSCGCAKIERMIAMHKTHGLTGTTEHGIWQAMIQRCRNPKHSRYRFYGGRGIRVCERWLHSFTAFLKDVGKRPSRRHSLDRENNLGHYEPGNVRWATKREQANNTRSNRFITINGSTRSVAEWGRFYGLRYSTLHKRLRMGWSPERAVRQGLRRNWRSGCKMSRKS